MTVDENIYDMWPCIHSPVVAANPTTLRYRSKAPSSTNHVTIHINCRIDIFMPSRKMIFSDWYKWTELEFCAYRPGVTPKCVKVEVGVLISDDREG